MLNLAESAHVDKCQIADRDYRTHPYITENPRLSDHAKVLHTFLSEIKPPDKDFFIAPQEQLAQPQYCNCSVRTVKRRMRELRDHVDEHGNPFPLIMALRTAGGRNVYKLLPLPDVAKSELGSETIGDKTVPRIRGGGGPRCVPDTNLELSLKKPSKKEVIKEGYRLLETEIGRALVERAILLCYDWHVNDPALTDRHRRNRQRANRDDMAFFTGENGLKALEYAIKKCERTSLRNGAQVLRWMFKGRMFRSEKNKIEKLREVA